MKEVYNVNQRGGATHVPRPTRPTISNKKETIIISAKEFQKLQEQLNTAKKALTEISEVKNLTPFKKGFETSKAVSKARDMRNTARQALAAIGGDYD